MKVNQLKIKTVEYKSGKLYVLNNIDNEKLNDSSEFLIGSITKIFTIIILLILQEKGKLKLTESISKYIKSDKDNLKNISIIDLINHESGMKLFPDFKKKDKLRPFTTASEVSEVFLDEKLITFEKGKHNYSNVGYILLGSIIENVTGLSYLENYHKYIIKPLKLKHTNLCETNITIYNGDKEKLSDVEKLQRFFAASAGCMHSCVNDLVKFAKNIPKLLNKKSLELLKKFYICKETEYDTIIVTHKGQITGGQSLFDIEYNKKWGIINIYIQFETIKIKY
jgi:CubicO group peptidase (beta-lactamase class C family)